MCYKVVTVKHRWIVQSNCARPPGALLVLVLHQPFDGFADLVIECALSRPQKRIDRPRRLFGGPAFRRSFLDFRWPGTVSALARPSHSRARRATFSFCRPSSVYAS